MRYLSVCSGIESASAAWAPMGWTPTAFSEIEPFPSAVLAHHYPDVPNLGDMTRFDQWPEQILADTDLLVGGTPCQAFSVAGLRNSLDDHRGNLTLTFVKLLEHLDEKRNDAGRPPVICLWENVPGVLNTIDNAFGCFLGALAGSGGALEPPDPERGWTDAGYVRGPERAIAWRVLDAQYFGLAQRRRRVFLVAGAGDVRPEQILFESEGVRRDLAPSREAGEGVAGTLKARAKSGGWCQDVDMAASGYMQVAKALRAQTGGIDREDGHTLIPVTAYANQGHHGGMNQTDVSDPIRSKVGNTGNGGETLMAFLPEQGSDAKGLGISKDLSPTLRANGRMSLPAVAFGGNNTRGPMAICGDVYPTIDANMDRKWGSDQWVNNGNAILNPCDEVDTKTDTLYIAGITQKEIEYACSQETDTRKVLRTLRDQIGEEAFTQWGLRILDPFHKEEVLQQALHGCGVRPAAWSRCWMVYCSLSREKACSQGAVQSVRETESPRCSPQGWQPSEQLAGQLGAYLSQLSQPGASVKGILLDLLAASQGSGVLRQALSAVQEVGRSAGDKGQPIRGGSKGGRGEPEEDLLREGLRQESTRPRDVRETRDSKKPGQTGEYCGEQVGSHEKGMENTPLQVRRLTVAECEFLMGYPRGYTNVPYRGKPAADGPRYKALGNSMAVPVISWIGRRMQDVVLRHDA